MHAFFTKLTRFTALVFLIAGLLLCIPLLLGFFGSIHPAFDSMGHFRLHLAAGAALCAVVLAMLGWLAAGLILALPAILVLGFHWQQLGVCGGAGARLHAATRKSSFRK
jgi:endonuclease/exonuclease/phosphatase (EEP) superfamily protein YafD